MAPLQPLLFFLFFFLISLSVAVAEIFPVPVWKDGNTHQYVTYVTQGSPPISPKLVVDLGGPFSWLHCHSTYLSPSYFPVPCRSIQCAAAGATGVGLCNNNNQDDDICHVYPQNTFTQKTSVGNLVEDVLDFSFLHTQASKPITKTRFLFSCAPKLLLGSLASGAQGMLGLGRSRISLPSQISTSFGFHRKFAICLPSSPSSQGALFFGDGPYILQPEIDASKFLMYTPLIAANSEEQLVAALDSSTDYFIGMKSIKINGKLVPLNASLLSLTKISTVVPYTTMETSVFVAVTKAFSEAAINSFNMTQVASIPPFGLCFSSNNMGDVITGLVVPTIDLVLQSEMVHWRIWGSNSMVRVKEDVMCLAMVDGGLRPINSIVVGSYQLENNLLQFDVASSRLGFSSSLLSRQTSCSLSPRGSLYQR